MGILTSCFVTFTVAMLFVSMLGGIYGQGRKRVFLGGFAIGAWGFLLIAYGPFNLDNFGNRMLTTRALDYAERAWLGNPPSYGYAGGNVDPFADARWQLDFIGNCIFTLACGLLCALVALRFARGASRHERAGDAWPNTLSTTAFPMCDDGELSWKGELADTSLGSGR